MTTLSERLLEHGIRLTNYGLGNRKATCPQCSAQRKHPTDPCLSVTVDDDHALWRCHNCGFSGRVNDGEPARSTNYAQKRAAPDAGALKLGPMPIAHLGGFWKSRSIGAFTLAKAGVQYGNAFFSQLGTQSAAFAFPHKSDGKIVNVKYRAAEAKAFANTKDGEHHLWLDHLWDRENGEDLVITEGEIDALSAIEAGIANVVSLPDGSLNPDTNLDLRSPKFAWASYSKPIIDAAKRIILALDHDAAGQFMAEAVAKLLGYHRCWTVIYPDGCKDLNDVLVKHGPEEVARTIDEAQPLPIPGAEAYSVVSPILRETYRSGYPPTFSTGFSTLDPLVKFPHSMLTVLTGKAGHGKSDLLDQITLNMARLHGWRFAIFSPEYEDQYKVIGLAQKYLGMPFFAGLNERMSEKQLFDDALAFIDQHYIKIDYRHGRAIEHILAIASGLALSRGLEGLVIDPYNAMERDFSKLREDQYIEQMLDRVIDFAKTTGVHVFFVVHPTKLGRMKNGKVAEAGLDSAAGAQAWQSKPDIGLVVNADFSSSTTTVKVEKCRYRWMGHIGEAKLRFDRVTGIFSDNQSATRGWNGY